VDQRLSELTIRLLVDLGLQVRKRLLSAFEISQDELARVVAREGGDEIFAIDRHVEPVIVEAIEAWPDELKPLRLIAEGLGEDGILHIEAPGAAPRRTVIIDPIDGTRAIMYQKRSAWFVAGVAEHADGREPRLRDIDAALLLELPALKQTLADHYTAVRGQGMEAWRTALDGSAPQRLNVQPSSATTLLHGHAHVANFFPGVKRMAADLLEKIVEATLTAEYDGQALVYDDQYPATAGQMVELIRGADRFTCDLRPLMNRILAHGNPDYRLAHTCHPYDCGAALVAEEAGVVLTNGTGGPFDAPLDVHTPMHWCGYANKEIQRQVEPVILEWLAEQSVVATTR
jgi:fructose-1,6-bisphosphatase/inositol monophosphatase family enzyme